MGITRRTIQVLLCRYLTATSNRPQQAAHRGAPAGPLQGVGLEPAADVGDKRRCSEEQNPDGLKGGLNGAARAALAAIPEPFTALWRRLEEGKMTVSYRSPDSGELSP